MSYHDELYERCITIRFGCRTVVIGVSLGKSDAIKLGLSLFTGQNFGRLTLPSSPGPSKTSKHFQLNRRSPGALILN